MTLEPSSLWIFEQNYTWNINFTIFKQKDTWSINFAIFEQKDILVIIGDLWTERHLIHHLDFELIFEQKDTGDFVTERHLKNDLGDFEQITFEIWPW